MRTETLLCECGCGTSIPLRDARGRSRRFVLGHSGGPSFGHEVTADTREKIRQTKLGKRNAAWKEEGAGYSALHNWLHRNFQKTGACDLCKRERQTEWSNLFGQYRHVREDFLEMCISCHRRYDRMRKRHERLRLGAENAG